MCSIDMWLLKTIKLNVHFRHLFIVLVIMPYTQPSESDTGSSRRVPIASTPWCSVEVPIQMGIVPVKKQNKKDFIALFIYFFFPFWLNAWNIPHHNLEFRKTVVFKQFLKKKNKVCFKLDYIRKVQTINLTIWLPYIILITQVSAWTWTQMNWSQL